MTASYFRAVKVVASNLSKKRLSPAASRETVLSSSAFAAQNARAVEVR
jgi:hypothetical protein